MSSPYSFVGLTLCFNAQRELLIVRESRVDCRGQHYIPAGRGQPGEDPLSIARRVTSEKAGLEIEPYGIIGVEHNPPVGQFPGQIRVFVLARPVSGSLKTFENEHSLDARWVACDAVRKLKLRANDFLPWLDDAVLEQPYLPSAAWRSPCIGS